MTLTATRRLAILLTIFAGAQASAQDPAADWRVRTIHGAVHSGPVSVGKDVVTVHLESPVTVPLAEVLDMVASVSRGRPTKTNVGGRVWLRTGPHFPVTKVAPAEGGIAVESPIFTGVVTYPFRVLRAVRFPRDEVVDNTRFQSALESPARTQDFFLALNDDRVQRVQVAMKSLTEAGVIVEFRGQEQAPVPMKRSIGVVFGDLTGAAPDPVAKPRAVLMLRTGERLQGRVRSLDSKSLVLQTAEGVDLAIPTKHARRLEFVSDKLVYLSSLEPKKADQTPAFDRVWPWMVDRSPNGADIQLGGARYDRGLVLFPKTALTYEVAGKYDHFEAVIGIEDRAGPQAHAIFRVYADGKQLFESEPFTVGAKPKTLKLPITSAQSLVIEADFGKNFDLGDHCVFADARITQK